MSSPVDKSGVGHLSHRPLTPSDSPRPAVVGFPNGEARMRKQMTLAVAVMMTRQPLMVDGKRVTFDALAGPDAHRVTFVCPLTDRRVPVSSGEADRPLTGDKGGLYRPGNLVMIAGDANATRATARHDVARYRTAVARASMDVEVPTVKRAGELRAGIVGKQYSSVDSDKARASIERGPYGIR